MSQINYPAGVRPISSSSQTVEKKKQIRKGVSAGNRGMSFEAGINETNAYYNEKGLCLVTKRPTPIKVVQVDYSHGPKITSAFYESQSTTDYNGVYQGHYLDFEAKETRSKTSFPLANIPIQQIEHLEKVIAQKGIAFFLIHFLLLNETYLLPASYMTEFYRSRPRASLPLNEIKEHGYLVKEGYRPRFDYLPVLEEAFLK